MFRTLSALALFAATSGMGTAATANNALVCVRDAMRTLSGINDHRLLGLIEEIKLKFADRSKYTILSCDLIDNVVAYYPPEGTDVPRHKYLIVNENFFRIATQQNQAQQHFLLGHEIGHHANSDFSNGLPRRQQELYADVKGACAVAHLGGSWEDVKGIIRGLRMDPADTPENYPSYPEAIYEAEVAYGACLTSQSREEGSKLDIPVPSAPSRSVYVVVQPKGPTIDTFERVVDRINGKGILAIGLPDAPSSIARLSVKTKEEPANLGELPQAWNTYSEWIMAFLDNSYEFGPDPLPLPTINGVFYLGPTANGTTAVSISLDRSGRFVDDENAAFLNLVITEDLVSVLVGFAALKVALDNGYQPSFVRLYADFTDQSLSNLRSHAADVDKFDDWTQDLQLVDELLEAAHRYLNA